MAKLYLIRRNLETFTGPMTAADMRDAYKRMQFGLQDEVSGHCGPWVPLEDLEKVKKHYPEVARIINEDMLAGWGVSNPGVRIASEDTKRLRAAGTPGVGLAVTFLVIALVALIAAIYMANGPKLSGKAKEPPTEVRPEDPQGYIERGDSVGFDTFMAAHADEIVTKASKQVGTDTPFLPYLRLYAFSHDGQINGLDPKVLRGDASAAPIDCSERLWRKRWRLAMPAWGDLVDKNQLVRAHWARLLAWDPHWIKRRDGKGWIGEQNYYTACLTMAGRALDELGADSAVMGAMSAEDRGIYAKIRGRLAWLIEASRHVPSRDWATDATVGRHAVTGLGQWTCFEAAKEPSSLAACRTYPVAKVPQGATMDAWQDYTEERYGWNLLRLATAQKGNLAPELAQALGRKLPTMNQEDHFTRFDYRAEAKLLKAVIRPAQPVETAVEKIQAEFPDVRLTH